MEPHRPFLVHQLPRLVVVAVVAQQPVLGALAAQGVAVTEERQAPVLLEQQTRVVAAEEVLLLLVAALVGQES